MVPVELYIPEWPVAALIKIVDEGEDRRTNPDREGKPRTFPDGWTMVIRAIVTKPQRQTPMKLH